MLKNQLKFIITIVLVLGLSISFQSLVAAWQAPSATPPSQPNIFKPINTGPVAQQKQGGLGLGGNLGVGLNLNVLGQITGGFGAVTTGGSSQDWNDFANTRPGSGYTLLTGDDAHGPGGSNYFHTLNFEYSSKDGSGNITQLAIPYANQNSINEGIFIRGRYQGTWTGWKSVGEDPVVDCSPVNVYAVNGAYGTLPATTGGTSATAGAVVEFPFYPANSPLTIKGVCQTDGTWSSLQWQGTGYTTTGWCPSTCHTWACAEGACAHH